MQTNTGAAEHSRMPAKIAFAPWLAGPGANGRWVHGPSQGAEGVLAGALSGLPDLERALINPAAVFPTPRAVLDNQRLMRGCKQEILRRWAWDEYLKEVAASEGMAEGEPSRLDEVKAALLRLGETWRPKPFAPATAAPLLRKDLEVLAA
jgi:hypothetical protein